MLVPPSSTQLPALAPLGLLICVDQATCDKQLGALTQALELGGCKPAIWRLDETAQAPEGVEPALILVGAAAHAASELRVVQVVYHLRQSFAAPVLVLPSLVDAQVLTAPWRNPFDGALPDVGDAQFYTQLHLWLRLRDAEARLQTAEQRMQAQTRAHEQLFSQLPFGVLIADNPDGSISYQNAAAARICGMAMPSIGAYEHYEQFGVLAEDGSALAACKYPMVRSLSVGEIITDASVHLRRGDGCVVELRVHSAPVRNTAGAITGAICLFRDVTMQNASLSKRQRAADKLRQITDASPNHIIVVDMQGCYDFANRTHSRWCQRTDAQLLGTPLAQTLQHSHFPLVQCALDEALGGTAATIEHVLIDAAGESRHFLIRWAPLREDAAPGGKVLGAIGYFVDINALRQIEMQIAQREMRFTYMSECLPIKVFTTDTTGGLNYLNATWHDYIGRLCDSSLGMGWMAFVHPDDKSAILARQPEYARATGAVSIEYRLRRHDGVYRWHRARCMPLPNLGENAEEREWVGVVLDIHEEIIARDAAIQRALENETKSQAALAAAGQAREEVDALQQERIAREQFVAMLSHDLRTPLTAARMGIERLQDALKADAKLSRIATRVARSISRTDIMLEDFLDVSRVCAGKPLPLTRTPQRLVDVVKATLDDMDPMHASRCFLAESAAGEGMWDASSMRRVLENLVGNALKYGERKTPVTIAIRQDDAHVVLTVHNMGEAIASEDQTRLFEHFDRLENATAQGHRGWGIGLTLVAGIARAYEGQVGVESSEARGTTFWVRLPTADVHAATTLPDTTQA